MILDNVNYSLAHTWESSNPCRFTSHHVRTRLCFCKRADLPRTGAGGRNRDTTFHHTNAKTAPSRNRLILKD